MLRKSSFALAHGQSEKDIERANERERERERGGRGGEERTLCYSGYYLRLKKSRTKAKWTAPGWNKESASASLHSILNDEPEGVARLYN